MIHNLIVDPSKNTPQATRRELWSTAASAIICRMTSTRLPGKTLISIRGKPLIQYTIDAIRHNLPNLKPALVTSNQKSDDPIDSFGKAIGMQVIRGHLDNVASRFRQAISELGTQYVFRVNGDSPLVPTALFPTALQVMASGNWDLVTNIKPRSLPPGMSIELVRVESFLRLQKHGLTSAEEEHVTKFFYDHHRKFRIVNLSLPRDHSHGSLAIDSNSDLKQFDCILDRMVKPHWAHSIDEILNLYRGLGQP